MTLVKGYQLSTIRVQWQPEWKVINYQRYDKYDLSERLPVINNTTNLSERLLVINDITDLRSGLPIINNMTNLSERLPVINNTSAIMTYVVVFSINTMQNLIIKYLLLLPSSKRLRLEVLHVLQKFEYKLSRKNYLQTNAFPNLVVVERGEYPHALQKKATGRRVTSKVVRETAGWTQPCLTLETSISASIIHYTIRWVRVMAE